MEEIHIKIGRNNLFVTGIYYEGENERGFPEIFEINSIECKEKDISTLLEWANSKPSGAILEIIENLVLEKRK